MSDPQKAMDWGGVPAEDDTDEIEEVDAVEDNKKNVVTSQLMKSPELLAALQSKLGSIVGTPSGYIASLPKPVKRRIKALKKLQLEATKIEAAFFQEINALECKYAKFYQPLYEKRTQITTGAYEPNDQECEWPSDDEKDEEELADEAQNKLKIEEAQNKDGNAVGIPEFWLTIFKNVETLAEMVQEHDEPILKHLKDIKVKMSETEPMGFTLEFHFEPNEYFNNTILTKEYEMKCVPDETDPFSFEGPEIVKCKGCTIDWKKGKNVTVKMIKKKQKHKSRGSVRTITKTVQNDSFFNFFNPPAFPDDDEIEVDEDTQALLAADFEIGHYIREHIVPRAVLYFTGEALDDEEYDEEEGEEEDDDNDDDDDEDHDPDFNPSADEGDKKGQAVSDCKQQ